MSFLNPGLLGLLALGLIPIGVHLLMRPKPRKLIFPALRLVSLRRQNNVRRLRLRHIWLLLLRVGVLALIVLALARPSLPPAGYALTRGELLRLLAIAGVGLAVYFALPFFWRRKQLPAHELRTRRTMLRGGTGLVVALLLLLLVGLPWQRRVAAELANPEDRIPDDLPVAAVLLFDTSLSMEYLHESKTRLEVARSFAGEQVEAFPSGSRVAIAATSTRDEMNFQSDLTGASRQLELLGTSSCPVPLNDRFRQAVQLLENHRDRTLNISPGSAGTEADQLPDRFIREVYIYTDLSRSAWQLSVARSLAAEIEERAWLNVYVIDVGLPEPVNISFDSLRLSREVVTEGSELVIRGGLLHSTFGSGGSGAGAASPAANSGPAREPGAARQSGTVTVELLLQDQSGTPVKQGEQQVRPGEEFQFLIPDISGAVVQGELRAGTRDAFRGDDLRQFTIGVARPPRVLLAAEQAREANFWRQALAPEELMRLGRKPAFECRLAGPGQLEQADLSRYDVVCLFSLRRLSTDLWQRLADFVSQGGGLFVVLGHERIDFEAWNAELPQSILPARLRAPLQFRGDEFGFQFLDLQPSPHPVLAPYDQLGGFGDLITADIRRYWRVEPDPAASVLVRYTDRLTEPALIERRVDAGRVMLLTTAVDDLGWGDLPYARWSFVALTHQLTRYLARQTAGEYNFEAGEDVVLRLPGDQDRSQAGDWLLRWPTLIQSELTSPAGAASLPVPEACERGHYLLFAAQEPAIPLAGFTVNLPVAESDFTRLLPADLDALLGAEQYSLARNPADLERMRRLNQVGQEMYGAVLILLIVVFCAEQFVANHFYEAEGGPRAEVLPSAPAA